MEERGGERQKAPTLGHISTVGAHTHYTLNETEQTVTRTNAHTMYTKSLQSFIKIHTVAIKHC